jgi:hypothetical protein
VTLSKKSPAPLKPFRHYALGLGLAFAAYVFIYALNSSLGGYWLDIEADGRTYAKEFSVSSNIMWQPRIGYSAWREGDFVGWIFRPLAALDQEYWHPTKDSLNDPSYAKWFYSKQAISEVHPKLRAKFEANRFINTSVQPSSP